METYNGQVCNLADALLLFEACRTGLLPRTEYRLSNRAREGIRSGSIFVWDEQESGIQRWTDGKIWGPSRIEGHFLTYREMASKYMLGSVSQRPVSERQRASESLPGSHTGQKPDSYDYKTDGLTKQSLRITTSTGQRLHLVSYYVHSHISTANLQQPTLDPALRHLKPNESFYMPNEDDQHKPQGQGPPSILAPVYTKLLPQPVCETLQELDSQRTDFGDRRLRNPSRWQTSLSLTGPPMLNRINSISEMISHDSLVRGSPAATPSGHCSTTGDIFKKHLDRSEEDMRALNQLDRVFTR